jgi:hypothetical protein
MHTPRVRLLCIASAPERCYTKDCIGCEDCGKLLAAAQAYARRSRNITRIFSSRQQLQLLCHAILLSHRHAFDHTDTRLITQTYINYKYGVRKGDVKHFLNHSPEAPAYIQREYTRADRCIHCR